MPTERIYYFTKNYVMKNHLIRFCALLIFVLSISCQSDTESDGNTFFEVSKLQGRYKVDLVPLISESLDKKDMGDGKRLGLGIGMAMLSGINIEVSFYDKNEGMIYMDGSMMNFIQGLKDKPMEQMKEFNYKLEQDSLVYIKYKDEEKYKRIGVIRTYGSNYDYIKLVAMDSAGNTKQTGINLKKLSD